MVSTSEELGRLAALRDQGVLTEDEFQAQKARLLSGEPQVEKAAPVSTKRNAGCGTVVIVAIVIIVIIYALGSSGKKEEDATKAAQPAIATTATELFDAYQANEAAAQSRFASSPLDVSGTVAGIDLDLTNDPVVLLATSNQFESAHAKLVDADKPRAASLSKGQSIRLVCQSVSEVIGTPMLDECTIQ